MADTIIAGPIAIYLGAINADPLDTLLADPAVPGSTWALVGVNQWDEDGATVSAAQSFEQKRINNSTAPVEVFRTTEDISVTGTTLAVTAETIAVALGGDGTNAMTGANNPVADVPSTSTRHGYRSIKLNRGIQVKKYALAVVGSFSGYDSDPGANAWDTVLWLPRAYESGSLSLPMAKSGSMVNYEFTALQQGAGTTATTGVVYMVDSAKS